MSLFLLDTDTLSLLEQGHAAVLQRVNGHPVPVSASANAIRMMIDPSGTHTIPLSTQLTCP